MPRAAWLCLITLGALGTLGALEACSGPPDPLGIDKRRSNLPEAGSPPEASVAPEEDSGLVPTPMPLPAVDASVDAAPVETPVSTLTLDVVVNGHGPVEKNMSNGEALAGDGKPLTINGVVYPTGLGVHSASEVNVSLEGKYKTFLADVGIDDEVVLGSCNFKVILDGVEAYDSGVITGAAAAKPVKVDVTGKQQLKLVVTNGGDTTEYDHADWGGARLVQ